MPDHPSVSPITRTEPTPEERIKDAIGWAEAAGRDMRVRCELKFYKPETQTYVSFPGGQYTVDVKPNLKVGLELKDVFDLFFQRLVSEGPAAVAEKLRVPAPRRS